MNSEFLRNVPYCSDLRCMLFEADELPLSAGEPVFDIDPYRASIQNLGRRFRGGVRRVAITPLRYRPMIVRTAKVCLRSWMRGPRPCLQKR